MNSTFTCWVWPEETEVLVLALIGTAALAFVNAFGSWVSQNRRRWIAWLFLVASWLLVLALVALFYRLRLGLLPLGLGLLLTVASSYLHARRVTAQVVWFNHILRLIAVTLVFWLAWKGLG